MNTLPKIHVKRFTVLLTKNMYAELEEIARGQGVCVSVIIRASTQAFLDNHKSRVSGGSE